MLAQRAAADAKRALRDGITDRLRHAGPLRAADHRHGETATLLTRGLDALDPYVTGYLPTMAATAVVPLTIVAWLLWTDWTSALILLVTLPLIPVFGALVGMHTARRTARQWRLLARLGGHFLDVVAGLPTLRAFGRERHQTRVVAEMADAHRCRPWPPARSPRRRPQWPRRCCRRPASCSARSCSWRGSSCPPSYCCCPGTRATPGKQPAPNSPQSVWDMTRGAADPRRTGRNPSGLVTSTPGSPRHQ
ncbi:ABC transporter transmembrane domain-containing protein, partial [Streptomyces sp. NPDC049099]|uniref:ABC transporter transmembrane domain-containing protein n=1 Tax=Streptomyces sp. NPDC049099 TaxID=3155768 RepID=UPI0034188DB0